MNLICKLFSQQRQSKSKPKNTLTKPKPKTKKNHQRPPNQNQKKQNQKQNKKNKENWHHPKPKPKNTKHIDSSEVHKPKPKKTKSKKNNENWLIRTPNQNTSPWVNFLCFFCFGVFGFGLGASDESIFFGCLVLFCFGSLVLAWGSLMSPFSLVFLVLFFGFPFFWFWFGVLWWINLLWYFWFWFVDLWWVNFLCFFSFVILVLVFGVLVWGSLMNQFALFFFVLVLVWGSLMSPFSFFGFGFWFGGLWWVHGYLGNIFEKHCPLPAFGIHYFLKKTAFPKIFPAIYFKFFSLKTRLVEREVASKEESSIWTNRPSVKQGFFYKENGIVWTELVRWGLSFKKTCYLERPWIIRKNVY